MSTRTNIMVVETNGDFNRTIQFYRQNDGNPEVTGKDLQMVAYMAKRAVKAKQIQNDDGTTTLKTSFRSIRNRFYAYLLDSTSYEVQGEDCGLNADIECLYRVKITREDDLNISIKIEYIAIPFGSDVNEYKSKLENGEGVELK